MAPARTRPGRCALALVVAAMAAAGACQARDGTRRPADRDVPVETAGLETATFAAGCFWCVEADFDKVPGVMSTVSGYTGGRVADPTYAQVSRGTTGHTEAVRLRFDPRVVTYEQLLDHYWRNVDPFVAHRQFCDVGEQYRPEIFVHSAAQRAAAEASRARLQERFSDRIVVPITDASAFYEAEPYHQNYAGANPLRYKYYRWGCGRDRRLASIWASR